MKRDYRLFLEDILSAMDAIERFVESMSLEDLRQDDKTASAVVWKFEIIGETAKHIPPHLRKAYPDIPWKEMQDRLIHGYFGIDYELVWQAIHDELPNLKPKIQEAYEYERQNP